MKITYAGKNKEFSSEFQKSAERKLKKFDRFFEDAQAQLKSDVKKKGESIELTIYSGGTIYRSEKRAQTMNSALDEAIEAILRQIRKNKTRLERKLKKDAFLPLPDDLQEEQQEDLQELPEFKVRTKSFPVKPMTVEDAILQMLLLEHDFFLFREAGSGKLNLVYRRAEGEYGLIIPD